MANKKNDALEGAPINPEAIPAESIGEEAEPFDLPKAEGITPISIATAEEIAKLPEVNVELTVNSTTSKTTRVTRHDYTATILFSYLTRYTFRLEDAEYGLICEELGKDYAPAQFRFKARCRIVGTVTEDGSIFYRIDVVLSDSVRKSALLDSNGAFIKLFLRQSESGKIEGIKPEIRKAIAKN